MEIREARKFGIPAEVKGIDFTAIMDRMRESVGKSRDRMKESLLSSKDLDFYFGEAHFTGDYTLRIAPVDNPTAVKTIKGKSIFIVTGARPLVPALKGIENIEYLTNESALELRELPESMIIIGGGYIAAEFAHFFDAMGTKVTIVQRNRRLVPEEEPEVSELLKQSLSRRMKVLTDTEAREVRQNDGNITVIAQELTDGRSIEISARSVLIAAGRRSNADLLKVENTGVKTDNRGYIVVDDYFETTKKNIWSFGDAIGKKMFRHAANSEAELVWHNAEHGKKSRLNYLTVPHAVFSYPEIASVGLRQDQAEKLVGKQDILVGKANYTDVARGQAMMETEAFTKAVVHRKTGKILGYHIIGPQASVLIQEVVNAMAAEGNVWTVAKGMHIHPALSEVVLKAFAMLREPG